MSEATKTELIQAAEGVLDAMTMPARDALEKIMRFQKAVEKAKAEK